MWQPRLEDATLAVSALPMRLRGAAACHRTTAAEGLKALLLWRLPAAAPSASMPPAAAASAAVIVPTPATSPASASTPALPAAAQIQKRFER
jgi:hypothetical protein